MNGASQMTSYYRILVTGSRSWTDTATILRAFTLAADRCPPGRLIVVVHGQCNPIDPRIGEYVPWAQASNWPRADRWRLSGLDWLAAQVCTDWGWLLDGKPADPRAGVRGKFARNTMMVHSQVDECLAFANACADPGCRKPPAGILHPTHGTAHCSQLAHTVGVPTTFWPGPGLAEWFTRKQHLTLGRNSTSCSTQPPPPRGAGTQPPAPAWQPVLPW
jgi:hypothetical protein